MATTTEEKGKGIPGRGSCVQRPGSGVGAEKVQRRWGRAQRVKGGPRGKDVGAGGSGKKLRFQSHHLATQAEE